MEKYSLLPEQLIYEGTCKESQFFQPELCKKSIIEQAHDSIYVEQLLSLEIDPKMIRRIGFPMTHELIERELTLVQGTLDASIMALKTKVAFNIAGGTHHAFRSKGEGFCLLNDNAIAAHYLLNNYHINRILIIDLDVHQGNGTADIFKHSNNVFTFSMHGKNNFPFEKEKSTWDIELLDNTDDNTYLKILKDSLPKVFDTFKPEFIFYQAGVDILKEDKMGKMACTLHGCKLRDEYVFKMALQNNLPIVTNMGGGYAPYIKTILEAHANTYRTAMNLFT